MPLKIVEASTGSGKSCWPASAPYFVDSGDPRQSRLPHSDWRPNQRETAAWLTDKPGSVIVLARSKNLQTQYRAGYGAVILFGRSNYPCRHPDAMGASCAECLFRLKMHKCPYANRCEYLLAKAAAKASAFTSLNFAYWLASRWPKEDGRGYVYLDEAHNLGRVVLDWAGCTITEKQRVDWQLPSFPHVEHRAANKLLRLPPPTDPALKWLVDAREVMASEYKRLEREAKGDERARERLRKCERLGRKLTATRRAVEASAEEWYVRSGRRGLLYSKPVPGFIAKPLTARNHFGYYFTGDHSLVAMSATIGKPDVFAKELGIDEYDFRSVPSRFPPERRPVHVLDVPRMSAKATPADFEHQADAIADFIKQYPPSWSGLIHTSRIYEEKLLHDRLCRRGLAGRVFYIRDKQEGYTPTDAQLRAWEQRKRRVPNSILITCSFQEGFDGREERINISVKVPYRRYGAPESYDRAWAKYSHERYAQNAAVGIMQQMGRTRRGEEGDYDTPDEIRGACAVADGSWSRIKSYFSSSFREALVE